MARAKGPWNPRKSSEAEDLYLREESDSPPKSEGRQVRYLADPLQWIGIGLLGIYGATVLAAALPIKLLDSGWINRICGSIRGGVSFPLEAMALILISSYFKGRETPMATRLRRLCSWVALGFVLMIPLQSWAGLKLIDLAIQNQQARIQPAENALKLLYMATNGEQLLAALRAIPGAPPNISGRFEEPVAKVRDRLISEIEPQVLKQNVQLNQVIDDIRRDSLISLFKDGIVSLFSALAFAAIGRPDPYQPTLIQKLFGIPNASTIGQLE